MYGKKERLPGFRQPLCFQPCGAGGSRTLVQTSSKSAFYVLILLLIFECRSEKGTQGNILSPLSYSVTRVFTEPA